MIEGILAWVCLLVGTVNSNPLVLIASGAFAVATQISRIVDRIDDKK